MRLRIRHVTTYDYTTPVSASTQLVRLTPRIDPGQRVVEWEVRLEILVPESHQPHKLRLGMPSLPIASQPSRLDLSVPELITFSAKGSPWEEAPPASTHFGSGSDGLGVVAQADAAMSTHLVRPFVPVPGLVIADDGYGNRTHLISLVIPHVATRLIATGLVETCTGAGVASGDGRGAHTLPASFWRRHTRHTGKGGEVERFVRESGLTTWHGRDASWITGHLDHLMHRVRDRLDFQIGATDVLTTADEALRRGAGVCQDHAHVMIAVARSLGIPARYVSGYLWPGHHVAAQASHAWVDLHVPGIGWVGFDPANDCRPTEAYVRVAVGLDYFDAPPTRGVRRGGPRHEHLGVTVEIGPDGGPQDPTPSAIGPTDLSTQAHAAEFWQSSPIPHSPVR
jgi:hypothetical protein